MVGLVRAIHALLSSHRKTWVAVTSTAMTMMTMSMDRGQYRLL